MIEQANAVITDLGDHDPNGLDMSRDNRDIAIRSIREGAALTVDEHNGTRFAKWKPFNAWCNDVHIPDDLS